MPTRRRYVKVKVSYSTTVFCKVAMTVTVVLRESPSRKYPSESLSAMYTTINRIHIPMR